MDIGSAIRGLITNGSGAIRFRDGKKKICLAVFYFDEGGAIHEDRLTNEDIKARDWEIEETWGWDFPVEEIPEEPLDPDEISPAVFFEENHE